MRRIKLVVAYDGTNYHGWQLQPNGTTIEAVLNEKLTELLREPITVIGASRTDSGVHALGNVAVFDTENRMPGEKICLALNQRLPEDIRVQSSEEVALQWHPRKCPCIKTYEYRILNRRIEMPVSRLYAYFCYFSLDVDKMQAAARYLEGEHDFKSFCNVHTQVTDTVRTIYSLTVTGNPGDMITIRVTGSGFLYNMVRILAGTLLDVGAGRLEPEDMVSILAARDRAAAGPTAPAKGLFLVKMEYRDAKPVL
ncbi:MAG: tRNA pseudouridine(38-40) synthase TruA [Clostridium sp.]|nr:tRNA pseudouridine(38-40) synthase TruA [Clostridium sp.]